MSSPAAAEIAIQVRDVTKTYGKAVPVPALRGVSLQVGRGERLALLGKSGSGKSTLLNLLAGLDVPSGGSIEVLGSDLARMRRGQLARYRLETVGMIFQAFNLVLSRTALQNVELPLIFAGRPPAERRKTAQAALEAVGLGLRLHHLPSELSGGEHQRVAIARALVNRPHVLLADEPTGNLDSATAAEVLDILLGHVRQRHMTLILVSHDEELARRCADRAVWLRDGLLA